MSRPKVHFISGLPRSGSTLLCNLLGQNPRFRVAGTSGLVDTLVEVRNKWDRIPEFRAMKPPMSERKKILALRGLFDNYFAGHLEGDEKYGDESTPWMGHVHFDKSRSWLGHMEMLEMILAGPAKVIVCVRDVRDVLASLEKLWRKNSATRQLPFERDHYMQCQSLAGRLALWTAHDGIVGLAYSRIKDAIQRGYRDRMLFVQYELFTSFPTTTLRRIYQFVGEPCPADGFHSSSNVEQLTHENDLAYDFPGLHEIRPKIEPQPSDWEESLGEAGRPFGVLNKLWEMS
jgi:sulfotransferase